MEGPDGQGKMVNFDYKKVVWKRYATLERAMLEYNRTFALMIRQGEFQEPSAAVVRSRRY